ncbi:MAG: ABC transporter permease [Clostridium sp.]|jgi:hypothetical protein|nr:ABC transporter permease [Clostridium sp.]
MKKQQHSTAKDYPSVIKTTPMKRFFPLALNYFTNGFVTYWHKPVKRKIFDVTNVASFFIFVILTFIIRAGARSQEEQTMASRWDDTGASAQVSVFTSPMATLSIDQIENFRHSIDGKLTEAAVVQESQNPSARQWVDAYSARGTVTLSNEHSSGQYEAIGIGGDFFMFHPYRLLYGSYFSGNDEWKDSCVIDEDAAWQLFGASNVSGKMVLVNGIPHTIAGVIRREEGWLESQAGIDSSVVYVSYETLNARGYDTGVTHYEVVMPNPVTGFALQYVQEQLGSNENNTEVVENSSRFDLVKRLEIVPSFAGRAMIQKPIAYPTWENVARGMENLLGLLTILSGFFLIYPMISLTIYIVIRWRNRKYTVKSIFRWIKNRLDGWMDDLYTKRKRRHETDFDI